MSDAPLPTAARKKRRSRPWHRVLGLLTALPLVWVMLTGAVLNHSMDWKLDRREFNHPWILAAYGMTPEGDPVGVAVGRHRITEWDGQIFLNTSALDITGSLVGAVADGDGIAVVTSDAVLRLDAEGNTVESLDQVSLPSLPINAVASADGSVMLRTPDGWRTADSEWLEFHPSSQEPAAPQALSPIEDDVLRTSLLTAWSQGGLPVSRIVLDLHAARFLGPLAKYFYDFVVICTLWLCLTGLVLFFRQPRRNR